MGHGGPPFELCSGAVRRLTVRTGILPRVPAWVWWIPIVVGVSLPFQGFTTRAQWSRVHVVPFSDPEDKPRDTVLNIAMFIPFGYLFARRRGLPAAFAGGIAMAAIVSIGAEATQLFSTARNPSGTDVSMAIAGAAIGCTLRWTQGKSGNRSR